MNCASKNLVDTHEVLYAKKGYRPCSTDLDQSILATDGIRKRTIKIERIGIAVHLCLFVYLFVYYKM